jgi:hypothetical protein
MTRPAPDSPTEDCLLKKLNVALERDGETVVLSRTAADHGRFGRARRLDWRGRVIETHLDLTALAVELGVVSRAA